jgi:hypothetical protein
MLVLGNYYVCVISVLVMGKYSNIFIPLSSP